MKKDIKEQSKLEEVIEKSISSIKSMIDTDLSIGNNVGTDVKKIYPINKVSVGLLVGAGQINKDEDNSSPNLGTTSAGFSVNPVGFLVVEDNSVGILRLSNKEPLLDILEKIPVLINSLKKDK